MNKVFTILILAFFIIGVAAAQDTLYYETVANGSLQNTWYPLWNGNNMEVEFMPGNPSGDSWVGKLGNDLSGGGVGSAFSGDFTWADFRLEAQVYIPVDPNTAATYYGIEFRLDSVDNGSCYQFLARFKQGVPSQALRFRSRVGAMPTVIKDWTAAEIPGGIPTTDGWHHLAVEVEGNQFRFFYDGNELPGGPYSDDTFTHGWIGTYVWDMAVSPAYLFIDDIYVINTASGIQDTRSGIISGYDLYQNFPNPFNPSTTISFELPVREMVELNIYNSLGQEVRSLIDNEFTAGTYQVKWNGLDDSGREAPAGVYFYKIQAGNFQATNKMLLLK
ncbi:MAG: T9SS type A sorting domain-containing protein [Psychromonas sp.]|nr:T9SS type A sorting domain-containing protein [Psychromonas sp.]